MRKAFVSTLTALAKKDPRIMLVTGDLGFNALEEFRDTLPDQYLNAGVAEQNMIGVAAGLALSGRIVFAYSIIPFVTYRCFEHVRDDVAYHNLPVCMVGVGGGYGYGILGSTHHSLEDVAIMRTLPNTAVICPGDPLEVAAAVPAIIAAGTPAYLRLGKAGEPNVHSGPLTNFAIGQGIVLQDGTDVALITGGTMLETGRDAAKMLQEKGISVRLIDLHTVKPIDRALILAAAHDTKLIVTLEEHGPIGGLGGAVAEVLSELPAHARHLTLSAPDAFAGDIGSQNYFRAKAGLTATGVTEAIRQAFSA